LSTGEYWNFRERTRVKNLGKKEKVDRIRGEENGVRREVSERTS